MPDLSLSGNSAGLFFPHGHFNPEMSSSSRKSEKALPSEKAAPVRPKYVM